MARPRSFVVAACIGLFAASAVHAQSAAGFVSVAVAGTQGHRGEAVCAWMNARLGTFGLEDGVDALRLEREETLPGGGARVLVGQLWHGLPVAGAGARAIVSADGRLTSLIAGFARHLRAPLAPRIAPAVAGERAARVAGRVDAIITIIPESITLTVVRRADGDHLEWEVAQRSADGEPVRTRIDAVSGDVAEADVGVTHAVGLVYPIDPRQPLEERELPGLLPGTPLRSSTFGISDQLSPSVLPIAPGDYRLMPEDAGFDQVNTYWHIEHDLHDFFEPLGYTGPTDSLIIRLHFPLAPEVGRTYPSFITLGTGIPGQLLEPSRAADIVYHELGHVVIYSFGIQPGGPNREAAALHEALADYFAAALTGDPAIGEWAYLRFPSGATRVDQPAPPWDVAHYDKVAFGAGGLGTSWGNGMILSSGLWDLRQQLGRTCDSLVFESLAYLPPLPTWVEFANALFFADRDHHGARTWRTIGEVLRRRGIRGEVVASISGPTVLPPREPAEFQALDCCGGTPGQYHWRARDWCRGTPCGPWRDLGDGDSVRTSFPGDGELELSVQSPFGDRDTERTFVRVTTPSLVFTGPTRIVKGGTGTWSLRVVAAAPWQLFVYRQWLASGRPEELLGRATEYTFAADGPFRLTATLTDWLGRTANSVLQVDAFTDRPPRDAKAPVRLAQFLEGASRAEVHVELGEATRLQMAVYDIRGRERVRLADDREPRGERVIQWDPRVLESGIYFLRASTASGHDAVVRFVLVR